jgi:hypothetical protein
MEIRFGMFLEARAECATEGTRSRRRFDSILCRVFSRRVNVHKIEITTRAGVPFGVQTRDKGGDRYHVSGTLRRKTEQMFSLDPFDVGWQMTGSNAGSGGGPGDIKLGEETGIFFVGGIVFFGYTILVTKK